eukprot:UN02510
MVEGIEEEYSKHVDECNDDDLEMERRFGETPYDDWNQCYNAIGEIDANVGQGHGCKLYSSSCCHTCAEIESGNYENQEYINIVRVFMILKFYERHF